MGSSVSKAAGSVGSAVVNTLLAPIKSVFGRSCKDICESLWDGFCFLEHLCIPDLLKLLLICGLCYVCLVFLYMLYKIGVFQCAVKSLFKMCWSACETYCLTMNQICCFCWNKIRNTERVYHGRRGQLNGQSATRDEELGYTSSSSSSHGDTSIDHDHGSSLSRKRKLQSRRRQTRKHHKYARLKSRQVSVHLRGRSRRGRRTGGGKHSRRSSMGGRRKGNSTTFKRQKVVGR